MTTPFTITVLRTRKRPPGNGRSVNSRKFRSKYFGNESIRWFVIDLLLFGLLAVLSAWPILQALEAFRML
jgi:hypothetical protein